jgi:hypothetical protein
MQFNFFLKNHHVSSLASLEDIICLVAAGLREAGHHVQADYSFLYPRPFVNIVFENTTRPWLVEEMRVAKAELGQDLLLGLIATEDPVDTISMGEGVSPRLKNMVETIDLFDFVWAILAPDAYESMLGGNKPVRQILFGHCPSLEQPPSLIQNVDVLLYGKLNGYRAPIVHGLMRQGHGVHATFGEMPEFLRHNMIQRSKLVLDMRRGEVVRFCSPSRICAALHHGSLVVAEEFDNSPTAHILRYAVTAPYGELVARSAGLLAHPAERTELADDLRRRFAAETSMRANMEALISTLPG